jgi:hypothetical protein
LAGCATGTSDLFAPSAAGQDAVEAASSGTASSGDPAASAGTISGGASGDSSGSSAGSSTGVVSDGGSGSAVGSTSGAPSASGANTSAGAPGGSSGAVGDAGDASNGAEGGSTLPGEGGSPCKSGPLYPIAAVASSVADPSDASGATFVAQSAIDGNLATRWESAFRVDPSWITLDFGFPVHIGELDILWHSDCASAYDIDLSEDGASWTTLRSLTANPASSQAAPTVWTNADVEKIAAASRYVRVHGTRRAQSQFGYSVWEMRALGDRDATCAP